MTNDHQKRQRRSPQHCYVRNTAVYICRTRAPMKRPQITVTPGQSVFLHESVGLRVPLTPLGFAGQTMFLKLCTD